MAKKPKGVSKEFKATNFDTSIKVSSSTISDLRAGKTFEGNVAKFKTSATPQQREAMNRFYGKKRVDTALGSTVSTINKTYGTSPGSSYNGASTNGYKAPKAATPGGLTKTGASVGNFVKNELLGVDDFSKLKSQAKNREFKNMAKSTLAGSFELGTTTAAVVGSAFTGGAVGGGYLAAKAATVAARTGAKAVVKQGAKTTAKKVGTKAAGAAVKAGTGSTIKGGIAVTKVTAKVPGKLVNAYKARGTMTPGIKAAQATAKTTKAASDSASAAYAAKKTAAAGKAAKGLGASYDTARAATITASKATNAAKKLKAVQATKLAKAKKIRAAARRAQMGHVAVHYATTPVKGKK